MIKLNEQFQTKSTTIMKNLKESLENWPEDNADFDKEVYLYHSSW